METFSALLAICAGNSPVPGEFPTQRPVTRSFDVFFDLRLNKRLSKQSWGWWFETLPRPLWRHSNVSQSLSHEVVTKNSVSPWARMKFSLNWRDKGGPYFSVGWMPMGHGNPGVEFQKCSYITFCTYQYKQDWRIFCHISLTHIFKVWSMGQLDNTVFP